MLLSGKQREQAVTVLRNLAREGTPPVRSRAAECLMEIGGERAVVVLVDLLADPHPRVRQKAAAALGHLRIHSAKPALQKLLITDQQKEVRIEVARALGRLNDRSGLPMVMEMLGDTNGNQRRLAVMSLHDIIGQRFSSSQEGVESAKRYLEIQADKLLNGDQA